MNKAEAIKLYDTLEKDEFRSFLVKRFVKPYLDCEKPGVSCFRILDFYGGDLFLKKLVDYFQQVTVKNQRTIEIYEIEKDKDLHFDLLDDAKAINQTVFVKNHGGYSKVIPYCGNLANFIHDYIAENQGCLDLV